MNWERYRDSYGPRVAIKFPYNDEAKNALKSSIGFPGIKWEGKKKAWSVRDSPQDLECALEILSDFGYHFEGLEVKEYTEEESDIEIVVRGQKLRMRWPYKPNYAEINAGVKACGEAQFDQRSKEWIIPLIAGMEVAHAVEPVYEALATAIRAIPQVQEAHEVMAERVLLSSAVDAEHMWLAGLTQMEEVRPYQWVAPHMYLAGDRQRLLLGDEMGLGKSLQALLCVLGGQYQKTLIVCPSVVKANWANEVEKWTDLKASVIYGRKSSDKDTHHNADIAIINYDLLSHRYNEICDLGYECIIFDECHNLKNKDSQRTQASKIIVMTPTVKGIICMSGTPILNRPSELFTVLNMLKPESFPNFFSFGKKYCGAIHNGYGWDFGGASNIETSEDGHTIPLNHLLKDIMLRRSMDDPRLSKQMPDLLETILEVEVHREQYDEAYNTCMEQLEFYRTTGSGSIPPGLLLNILTELRHAAGLAKTKVAENWMLDYYEQTGKPLVVFAHHKDVIERLADASWYDVAKNAETITGSTPDKDRQRIIADFQEGKIQFLICSTLAMKEGVNLDRADTTLFVERQWVPAHEKQAAARVRRLTQGSSTCHKVVLSAKDTVDTHFDKVVSGKEAIVKAALDDGGEDKMAIAEAVAASLLKGRMRL
jgi:SWI/SNF-related matrix-associated actin-dependent regulator 1 of chromatin subfamily A